MRAATLAAQASMSVPMTGGAYNREMPGYDNAKMQGYGRRGMAAGLLASVAWFAVTTIHWPITGDAALMHYVAFLVRRGWVPYRDIADINFPGSYLPDLMVRRIFGAGAVAWRLYDLCLLAVVALASQAILRRHGRFAAVWAGCIFAVVHGRDGLNQVGQRDLTGTAFILAGFALFLEAKRERRLWPTLLWGLCAGGAAILKPTFSLFLLVSAYDCVSRRDRLAVQQAAVTACGWLVAPLGCIGWLASAGGLAAFRDTVTVLVPYHASLGHPGWKFLVYNSVSPLLPVVAVWLGVLAVSHAMGQKERRTLSAASLERRYLWVAAGVGCACYLLQGKGYPYHRYPLLAFLLISMAIDLTEAAKRQGLLKGAAVSALLWSSLVLAPSSAWKASRYDWRHKEPQGQMQADLAELAGAAGTASLDHHVQCLDSISGCIGALYDRQLVQATGTIYDEFLFNAGSGRAVRGARERFAHSILANPPRVFVVTDPLFPSGPDQYRKLEQWPEFAIWLGAHYELWKERQFSTPLQGVGRKVVPPGYRLYVRRAE